MSVYYNENDLYAAEWLKNLIEAGYLPEGDIDTRNIQDISVDDLIGYNQHHFFAGIGGWALALWLAGWPENKPVWTGSPPCQPFSTAGKKKGISDERHLWPVWFELIKYFRPNVIFGEQVARKTGLQWLDIVCNDLENTNYSVGAFNLCAPSVGAPHQRQRLYFVGENADGLRWGGGCDGNPTGNDREVQTPRLCSIGIRELGDSTSPRWTRGEIGEERQKERESMFGAGEWTGFEWLPCRDGKYRPTKPGLFPLAYGLSRRMGSMRATDNSTEKTLTSSKGQNKRQIPWRIGMLRGYGNAIIPDLAARFIRAYLEGLGDEK